MFCSFIHVCIFNFLRDFTTCKMPVSGRGATWRYLKIIAVLAYYTRRPRSTLKVVNYPITISHWDLYNNYFLRSNPNFFRHFPVNCFLCCVYGDNDRWSEYISTIFTRPSERLDTLHYIVWHCYCISFWYCETVQRRSIRKYFNSSVVINHI